MGGKNGKENVHEKNLGFYIGFGDELHTRDAGLLADKDI
jgi:hypothetical protein